MDVLIDFKQKDHFWGEKREFLIYLILLEVFIYIIPKFNTF